MRQKSASQSCSRIERKYGSRMSQEQQDRLSDRKNKLDALADWASKKRN